MTGIPRRSCRTSSSRSRLTTSRRLSGSITPPGRAVISIFRSCNEISFHAVANNYQELKDRLIKLSDEQLIDMMLSAPGEYRQDALDIAKAELKWRGVEIPKAEEDKTAVDPVFTDPT